jgi:hypothetical protein
LKVEIRQLTGGRYRACLTNNGNVLLSSCIGYDTYKEAVPDMEMLRKYRDDCKKETRRFNEQRKTK